MQDLELARTINRWQRLVWEEIYLHRKARACQRLVEAYKEHARFIGTVDAKRALHIYLKLLESDLAVAFAEDDETRGNCLQEALASLAKPEKTRLASSCRARVLLILGAQAQLLGVRRMPCREVDALLAVLPESSLGHQTCNYLALWAFAERSLPHLREAQRLFSLNPHDFMPDFTRQRIAVMLSLLEDRATAAELSILLELLPHQIHLQWYERWLVPEAEAQGVWNSELASQLAAKRSSLQSASPTLPPRSPAQGRSSVFN